jgi:hypothetical protein
MHDQDTHARTRDPSSYGGAHEATGAGSQAAVAADTAKETVKDEARNVAGTARQEAGAVVGEARSQVQRIASQARDQAKDRVQGQHSQLVDRLRGLADEFQAMGGDGDTPGKALVGDLGQRGRRVADYLADRGPEGLLSEVTQFARRRPLAFLAGAVAAGFLAGRLGKNVWKAQSESGPASTGGSVPDTAAPKQPESVDIRPTPSVAVVGGPGAVEPPGYDPAVAPVTPAVPPGSAVVTPPPATAPPLRPEPYPGDPR